MAESTKTSSKQSSQIKEGETIGPPLVQSTTEATPTEASETSMPNVLETETEAPPIHTAKPDVPIAQTLAAGAGAHTPPDPKEFDEAGRPRDRLEITEG